MKIVKSIGSLNFINGSFNKCVILVTDADLNVLFNYNSYPLSNSDLFREGSTITEDLYGFNALLAARDTNGIAFVDEEEHIGVPLVEELCSCAVPLFDYENTIIGYIGLFSRSGGLLPWGLSFVDTLSKLIAERLNKGNKQINKWYMHLSSREIEVLNLVVIGITDGEIAKEVSISKSTVRSYLTSIFEKLGVKNRFELMFKYYQN
ncbi:LuxR family transcriptional regulator [Cohnella thailandensis]|uniref:HTH luxR-type domain-containing protein n=1 Tax=Cohnella thailandensis TaxID=557557 RepID=A0A841SZM0_9BACL|nr:helix-turn-helix transcriptional regulator [Cohnella thailandensis]MBB6635695.1 hypothetical protein [Cohnella thailandensis]MBP1976071.1 DNA-binding CsgD family transcriptional regulator [Cohnella thailandensis]